MSVVEFPVLCDAVVAWQRDIARDAELCGPVQRRRSGRSRIVQRYVPQSTTIAQQCEILSYVALSAATGRKERQRQLMQGAYTAFSVYWLFIDFTRNRFFE